MSNVKAWWKAAGIRALKTVAQAAIAVIGTAAVLNEVDWRMVVSAAILAGILSLLTSIAGLPEVSEPETTEEAETEKIEEAEKTEDKE